MEVGHRSPPLGVEPEIGKSAGRDGLEMDHQMPADEGMVEPGQQQESGRLHRSARHHHVSAIHGAFHPIGADEVHARRPVAIGPDP